MIENRLESSWRCLLNAVAGNDQARGGVEGDRSRYRNRSTALSYVPSFSLPSPWFLVVGDALPVLPPAFPSVSVDDRGGVPSGSNACVGQIARIRHVGMAGGEEEIRHGPELGAAARVMIRCAAARVSLTLHNEQ